ncbi:MAG: tyrosine-protein phosphatase [Victivallales bacterium]|nr:tyrosine-protein phosphatase [Victivallales bacterium]
MRHNFFLLLVVLTALLMTSCSHGSLPPWLSGPADGSTVPVLTAQQHEFLLQPREERVRRFVDADERLALSKIGGTPEPVVLKWNPEGNTPPEDMEVIIEELDEQGKWCPTPYLDITMLPGNLGCEIRNFKVDTTYRWGVGSVKAMHLPPFYTFRAADTPPRLMKVGNIPNFRDAGGWKTIDGKRVHQGLVYRSAAYSLSDENRDWLVKRLGIQMELDLRLPEDAIPNPPTGYLNVSGADYAHIDEEWGRQQCTSALRLFFDRANYPILVHCSAGQDRTGTIVFIINALLGVPEEDLFRDWEATAFTFHHPQYTHETHLYKLFKVFDQYPGETLRERVEQYVFSLGFTTEDLATLRNILLEK